jgi:uncharacterized protein YegP (UPF0339 family)
MKIEIYCRKRFVKGPLWFFRVRAANGEIIAQSEGYSRRIDAMSTIRLLRAQLANAEIVDA